IEPLLYRAIRLSTRNRTSLNSLLKAIESKPAHFLHTSVRHLCLDRILETDATRILGVCTGVVDLALNSHLAGPDKLPLLAKMRPQKLSTYLYQLFGGAIDLAHPAFASVTHLDVIDINGLAHAQILAQIPTLPALTHLAFNSEVAEDAAHALLDTCHSLQLLLWIWIYPGGASGYRFTQTSHIYDVRFVKGRGTEDYWADWEASAKGLPSLWSRGDEFVARKRRGEIAATCYWLP
ncbi:hypothetical protein DFH06DRAFT_1159414, partial [Mycena polygramma]